MKLKWYALATGKREVMTFGALRKAGAERPTIFGNTERFFLYKASQKQWVSSVDEGLYAPC